MAIGQKRSQLAYDLVELGLALGLAFEIRLTHHQAAFVGRCVHHSGGLCCNRATAMARVRVGVRAVVGLGATDKARARFKDKARGKVRARGKCLSITLVSWRDACQAITVRVRVRCVRFFENVGLGVRG